MLKTINYESLKTKTLDLQRWENEGGLLDEHNELMTDWVFVQPAPINRGRHHRSLQWNERFVIEPLHPANRIFLIRKNMQRTLIMASEVHRKGNPDG